MLSYMIPMKVAQTNEIGIICFDESAGHVRESIVKMLEIDGYQVGIWKPDISETGRDKLVTQQIELYKFIKNQYDNIVVLLTAGSSKNVLMEQILQMAVEFKDMECQKRFLVVECGERLPLEFQGRWVCLDGEQAGSARLAMQIGTFFNEEPKTKETGNHDKKDTGTQNIVVAGVIKNSSFF